MQGPQGWKMLCSQSNEEKRSREPIKFEVAVSHIGRFEPYRNTQGPLSLLELKEKYMPSRLLIL